MINFNLGTLQQLMPESAFKGTKSRDSWTQEVIKEFEKLELNKGKKTPKQVRNVMIQMLPGLYVCYGELQNFCTLV